MLEEVAGGPKLAAMLAAAGAGRRLNLQLPGAVAQLDTGLTQVEVKDLCDMEISSKFERNNNFVSVLACRDRIGLVYEVVAMVLSKARRC